MLIYSKNKDDNFFTDFLVKSVVVLLFVSEIFFLASCGVFNQAKAYERFIHSRFAVSNVRVLSLSGMDVSHKENYTDLDFSQVVHLGIQIMKGDVPVVMEITVTGLNPSSKKAAISGMDWLLLMKADTLATGTIDRPVVLPPGQKVSFSVKAHFNLVRLLKSGSLEQIFKAVLGNAGNREYKKLGLVFKFRPWYQWGRKLKRSPLYFAVHPRFN